MCEMAVFVKNVQVCFTWLLWKLKTRAVPAYWQKKKKKDLLFSAEKWEEKRFFSFVFHIEWLNFTLHWHIWGDAPWNQSNSGISEEQYFETSWDMWPYYFLHLWTDYTIMWQLQRWNCGDSMFPTLVNWFLTALWTETIEQITNDSTKGINSFCNLNLFSHVESWE